MADEVNPMAEAEAQLYRRIQELRERARSQRGVEGAPAPGDEVEGPPPAPPVGAPALPDLRSLLARTESHVEELRRTAASLEEQLPERVERAVIRAVDDHATARRLDDLGTLVRTLSAQLDQLNRDLLAERLGRIEDLEMVVDLMTGGVAALRQDVVDLAAATGQLSSRMEQVLEKLDQPLHVTVERPPSGSGADVRELFRPAAQEEPAQVSGPGPGDAPG